MVEEAAEIVEASKKLPNLEDNKPNCNVVADKSNKQKSISTPSGGATTTTTASTANETAELPRLIGTKSQASTASSSATRDSGISVNDVQKAAELVKMRRVSKTSVNGHHGNGNNERMKNRNGSSKSVARMISVDDLPISGRAMPLGKRPSTNRSSISNYELSSEVNSRMTSKSSITESRGHSTYSRSHSHGPRNGLILKTNEAIEAIHQKIDRLNDDVTPPRSPLVVQSKQHLLLRPSDNRKLLILRQNDKIQIFPKVYIISMIARARYGEGKHQKFAKYFILGLWPQTI